MVCYSAEGRQCRSQDSTSISQWSSLSNAVIRGLMQAAEEGNEGNEVAHVQDGVFLVVWPLDELPLVACWVLPQQNTSYRNK